MRPIENKFSRSQVVTATDRLLAAGANRHVARGSAPILQMRNVRAGRVVRRPFAALVTSFVSVSFIVTVVSYIV